LLDIGAPLARIGAGEIIAAPGKRIEAGAFRARVGAGDVDFGTAYAKASAIQKREGVRAGTADETHIVAGLANVPFEHRRQLHGGERTHQED
jgi:hypothetical protein